MTFEEVFNNQELAAELEKAEDMAAILQLLKEAGVEMTEEQLLEKMNQGNDQLNEDDLEKVSGGSSIFGPVIKALWNWLRRKHYSAGGGGYGVGGGGNGAYGGGGTWGSR